MSRSDRVRRRLTKTLIVAAFVGGLAFLGASWSVYADRNCLAVPSPSYCGEARWVMVVSAIVAIGAVVALWLRALRRSRT